MAKAVSRSKKSNKKSQSGFLSRFFHSWWGWLILVALLLMASFCAYKYIRYQSAPAEIKLIRQDPIYSYESENLKIVKISEDYGGKDWKGVWNDPAVSIRFGGKGHRAKYEYCVKDIGEYLTKNDWSLKRSYEPIGGNGLKSYVYANSREGHIGSISLRPSSFKDEVCSIRLSKN